MHTSEQYFQALTHFDELGIKADLQVDFLKVMQRKELVVKNLVNNVKDLLAARGVEFIVSKAKLTENRAVLIKDESGAEVEIEADKIILATGSLPIDLKIAPLTSNLIIDSTGALSLKEVPKELIVLGGGVIGVEMASIYSRFGAKVTVVEMMKEICPGLDAVVSKNLQKILTGQGINFLTDHTLLETKIENDKVTAFLSHKDKKLNLTADKLLVATGRKPNVEGLNLEKAGVALNSKGQIEVNGQFETSVASIYAVGDVIDGPMLAHKASQEAVSLVDFLYAKNAKDVAKVDYIAIPNVIYCSPEVATVGLTELQAKAFALNYTVGSYPFKANPRARATSELEGFVKVIGDKDSGRLLGVHIIGAKASEIISSCTVALSKRVTLKEFSEICFAHPTLSEVLKEATLVAMGKSLH